MSTAGGTRVSYRLSEQATVTFTVARSVPGVRKGRRCVKAPTPIPAKAKRCSRYLRKGSFTAAGASGANSLRFSGRLAGKPLAPGSYRLTAEALDSSGNRSATPPTRPFRILSPAKRR